MREEFTNMRDLEGEGGRYFLSKDKDIISVSQNSRGDDPLDFLSEYFSLL